MEVLRPYHILKNVYSSKIFRWFVSFSPCIYAILVTFECAVACFLSTNQLVLMVEFVQCSECLCVKKLKHWVFCTSFYTLWRAYLEKCHALVYIKCICGRNTLFVMSLRLRLLENVLRSLQSNRFFKAIPFIFINGAFGGASIQFQMEMLYALKFSLCPYHGKLIKL
jgi:hypothetical protein